MYYITTIKLKLNKKIKLKQVGAILGYIGSDLVFPHNHTYNYDDDVKELRLCAPSG